ncbi:MAG: hypothetical protein ACJASR_001588 [Psychroserpens sp.]|jgi:hypothetical protein
MQLAAKRNKTTKNDMQFWEQHYQPIELWSNQADFTVSFSKAAFKSTTEFSCTCWVLIVNYLVSVLTI